MLGEGQLGIALGCTSFAIRQLEVIASFADGFVAAQSAYATINLEELETLKRWRENIKKTQEELHTAIFNMQHVSDNLFNHEEAVELFQSNNNQEHKGGGK